MTYLPYIIAAYAVFAVVLAWDAGHSFMSNPINQFKTLRSNRDTLLRLAVPVTNN